MAAAAGVLQKDNHPTSAPRTFRTPPPIRWQQQHLRNGPRAARDGLPAALAVPDAHAVSLDRRLAAKGAGVAGVLGDFHLLHLFAEGGAVSVGFSGCFVRWVID